eukprot:1196706-Alexandrium_andersonii.AAC.1
MCPPSPATRRPSQATHLPSKATRPPSPGPVRGRPAQAAPQGLAAHLRCRARASRSWAARHPPARSAPRPARAAAFHLPHPHFRCAVSYTHLRAHETSAHL